MTETDADGTTQRWFIYGNYIDEVLLIKADSNDYYYAQDHLYSPAALINSSGSVVERYEYDAYGDCNIMDASYNPRSSSNYGNPYYFQGKRLDLLDDGGLELMTWPYRNYSTYLGRWLQAEKLGMIPNDNNINPFRPPAQYEDGLNFYEYVRSSPVTEIDSFGLLFLPIIKPPKPCGYFKLDAKPTLHSIKKRPLKKRGCLFVPKWLVKMFIEGELKKRDTHIRKERKCTSSKCKCRILTGKCFSLDIYPEGSKRIWDCLIIVKLKVHMQTCFGAGICCKK